MNPEYHSSDLACHPYAGDARISAVLFLFLCCAALRTGSTWEQTDSLLPSDECALHFSSCRRVKVLLAGPYFVVRVRVAPGQLRLLQIGPRRCLQLLRAAPFWFLQLLLCDGGIVTFALVTTLIDISVSQHVSRVMVPWQLTLWQ